MTPPPSHRAVHRHMLHANPSGLGLVCHHDRLLCDAVAWVAALDAGASAASDETTTGSLTVVAMNFHSGSRNRSVVACTYGRNHRGPGNEYAIPVDGIRRHRPVPPSNAACLSAEDYVHAFAGCGRSRVWPERS